MELSSAVGAAKNVLSLKLETPYMFAASILGFLGMCCILPGSGTFRTPFEGLAKFFAWTGWSPPTTWLNTVHHWIADPSRIEATQTLFLLLAALGTVFASYSRASFAAMVGVTGLVETGATTQAWLVPVSILAAMVVTGRFARRWSDDLWEKAGWTCFWMLVALAYWFMTLGTFVFGEQRTRKHPQSVKIELSWETRSYIDKRLTAFGMPDLNPPVIIPPIVAA